MATVWSILATFAMIASAGSFAAMMYPATAPNGLLRSSFGVVMVGSGILTVIALHMANGLP